MTQLIWLPRALQDAGLHVIETPGWLTRGRPGAFGPIRGVLCHHTAGPLLGDHPSLGIVTNGRSDLPGPLAQLLLARNGTFHVVAAGRCNHAGKGYWNGVTAGNTSFVGIEAENTGLPNDFPWPEEQMHAYALGCAAILKKIGAQPIMCVGHKEYARPIGRKPDPDFNMTSFRARVATEMARLSALTKEK